MKYVLNYESENAEQDFANIMDTLMLALERGAKIYKDLKSEDQDRETMKTVNRIESDVANLGSKLDDFREVFTEKTSPSKKDK